MRAIRFKRLIRRIAHMLVGYARTSTAEQTASFEAQQMQLKAVGCERVFAEQTSAVAQRQALAEALEFMRAGDSLVVTKADRLARSTAELLKLVEQLEKRSIGLRILSMAGIELDTKQATSKLMLTMLAAIAEFERALMLERQKEGIARAKAEKRYKGRMPKARNQLETINKMREDGAKITHIAKALNISRGSVHRVIKESQG